MESTTDFSGKYWPATGDGKPYKSIDREGEIDCLHYLFASLEEAGVTNLANLNELKIALKEQAKKFIERDPSKWKQYCRKPSVYITKPDSIFYEGNEDAMQAELSFILNNRNKDGVWNITWGWGVYEKEFAISENWWKAVKGIEYMLLLKNFQRIESLDVNPGV